MAVINELITELGINLKEGSAKKIDEFEKKIRGVSSAIEKMGHMVTGGLGIKDFFGGAIGRAQDIMNTSRAIGMSTDALQKWQYAAKVAGVSSDSVISDLQNLNANYFMTEKGVLGLADSMKRMSAQTANWWGNQLGISQDTILLLREGSQAILERQKAAKEAGAITPLEELEKAHKMKMELDAQKERFLKLADVAAYKLLPVVSTLMEKFNEWLGSDPGRTEMIVQGMTAALIGLTASNVTNGILNLISSLTPIAGIFWKISKQAFSALGAILNFAARSPAHLMLVSAAITGLSLAGKYLYDDFKKYKEGKDSWIPWGDLEEACDKAIEKLKEFGGEMKRIWKESPEWLQVLIKGFGEGLVDAIHSAWSAAQELMGGLILLTDWALTDRTLDGLKERISALHEEAWGWLNPKEPQTKGTVSKPTSTPITAAIYHSLGNVSESKPIEDALYNLSNKMPTELTLKSTSVRAFAEVMHELNTSQPHSNSSVVKNADFNGATIQIIATGADLPDVLYSLEEMGADTSDSYNGTGFIN